MLIQRPKEMPKRLCPVLEGNGTPLQYSCLEKSHGWRSLVGCSPWGRYELDTTERLPIHFSFSCIGEGNGNPLQCSCLENPRDGGAWWALSMGSYRVGHDWSDLAAAAVLECLVIERLSAPRRLPLYPPPAPLLALLLPLCRRWHAVPRAECLGSNPASMASAVAQDNLLTFALLQLSCPHSAVITELSQGELQGLTESMPVKHPQQAASQHWIKV